MHQSLIEKFKETHKRLFQNESERRMFDLEMNFVEIGGLGSWVASSNKREHTVHEVRSFDRIMDEFQKFCKARQSPPMAREVYITQRYPNTYWQSEGKLPHFLKCAFGRLMQIDQVALYLDFNKDQSYTPLKLTLYWGTCPFEIFPMDANSSQQMSVEVGEPNGWVYLLDGETTSEQQPMFAKCLTIVVTENHRGGNDSRIRQVRIYTPRDFR